MLTDEPYAVPAARLLADDRIAEELWREIEDGELDEQACKHLARLPDFAAGPSLCAATPSTVRFAATDQADRCCTHTQVVVLVQEVLASSG